MVERFRAVAEVWTIFSNALFRKIESSLFSLSQYISRPTTAKRSLYFAPPSTRIFPRRLAFRAEPR